MKHRDRSPAVEVYRSESFNTRRRVPNHPSLCLIQDVSGSLDLVPISIDFNRNSIVLA
jgi:hypothetical protein